LLPIRLWGLDPLYWCCAKLSIADVLSLSAWAEGLAGAAYKLGSAEHPHPIARAEVLGTIVGVVVRAMHVIYDIDDGSGVLPCTAWFSPSAARDGLSYTGGSAAALYRMAPRTAGGFVSSPVNVLALGCVVRVRGRIGEFWRDATRQLTVESVCQLPTTMHMHCTTL